MMIRVDREAYYTIYDIHLNGLCEMNDWRNSSEFGQERRNTISIISTIMHNDR